MKEAEIGISSNGIRLRGRIFQPDPAIFAPAVIILHGIPRSKPAPGDPGYFPLARELAELGFLTLFFNFRGAGESGGNFQILGWSEDLKAALDWLEQNHHPEKIALLGFSGGAAVAIHRSARDPRISAVASLSSPAHFSALEIEQEIELWLKSFREIGLIRDPDFPRSVPEWLQEFEEVSPINWVDQISPRPLLIVHGDQDEIVPARHAEQLFAKAGAPKELFWIKQGMHRLRVDPRALEKAKDWLQAWKESGVSE